MICYQKTKPFVPKYANFIGWIRIYYEYRRANDEKID